SRRRIVLPGLVLAVSRRTTRRHMLFVPDLGGESEAIFWYCLATAARERGVLVHAAVLMSNHLHLVITDVRGEAPKFYRRLHRLLALCTKARFDWPEEVVNKSATAAHELVSGPAIIKALGYAIANPTTAGLVRRADEWPGARTSARDMGTRTIVAKKPEHYFRGEQWDDEVELEITLPPALEAEMKPDEIRRRVQAWVSTAERAALEKSKQTGLRFLGARRAQRVPHTDRASSWEDFGSRNPRFSAAGDAEAARRTVERNRQFEADYDKALAGWMAGDRKVVFPPGTWWMRVHHHARVRPPP
ncbi:MAG: transposase, partial [Sandaracinaceae bacterium]